MELRIEVTPAAPLRLPRAGGMDGLLRCRGGVLERLLHYEEEPVRVRAAQTSADRVLFGACSRSAPAARHGIERMRFALGVDDDLHEFYRRFAHDPLIGRSVRRRPWLRSRRRPEPFEALAWAICEQLIEYERAAAIQRRIVRALGRRWPDGGHGDNGGNPGGHGDNGGNAGGHGDNGGNAGGHGDNGGNAGAHGLRDAPTPHALAGVAPARLQSWDLGGARACTLVRAAREVASGRADLRAADHERAWRRLRAIPGIGPWTVEMLALHGQGRYDQVPAGDVGLLELVGRRLSGGDPRARASEEQVRAFFAPYGRWAGLAAVHTGAI